MQSLPVLPAPWAQESQLDHAVVVGAPRVLLAELRSSLEGSVRSFYTISEARDHIGQWVAGNDCYCLLSKPGKLSMPIYKQLSRQDIAKMEWEVHEEQWVKKEELI
jgi:hypothetical protein